MSQQVEEARVRLARPNEDAAAILAIYAPFIERTAVSFETIVPPLGAFTERIEKGLDVAPWLVCHVGDTMVGFACGSRHRERAAYLWSVELSVYVAPPFQGNGYARRLYAKLIAMLRDQGYYNAYAGITLPNPASVGMHEAMGFVPVGVFRSVGFKLGNWHDVGWWQRVLRQPDDPPRPPLSIMPVNR